MKILPNQSRFTEYLYVREVSLIFGRLDDRGEPLSEKLTGETTEGASNVNFEICGDSGAILVG